MNISKIQLLLVDDNPLDAALTQRLLTKLGEELSVVTRWVDTAEKAMTEIREHPYDLLLLDYQLPGASGLDVLEELKKLPHGQQPAVIMLTASGNEKVAVTAMRNGAKDYLRKDELDAAPLLRALMSALSQKRMQDQLELYVAQTQADLRMARQLQHALLPQRFPVFPQGVDVADTGLRFCSRYVSTTELGGDFYDVLRISDTRAGVFVCDVMGHGVRASLVTAMIRALVEELLSVAHDPSQFLAGINDGLFAILKNADEPLFATAFYLVADLEQGRVSYASAGHPLPFHLCREPARVATLPFAAGQSGPALGIFEGPAFGTARQNLAPHDMIILFTDGLFEVRNAEGREFGQERLLEAVRARVQQPVDQLFDEILDLTRAESADGQYDDDVCLLGVEMAGTNPGGTRQGKIR